MSERQKSGVRVIGRERLKQPLLALKIEKRHKPREAGKDKERDSPLKCLERSVSLPTS